MIHKSVCLSLVIVLAIVPFGSSQDLYMKDTPADTGVEPNPDTGAMWISDDIWVRKTRDPGYQPYPFPEGAPAWVPLPHENPEYRDPKYSVPNYIYVRVRNRGSAPSTGTERLRVYWAKASTGLSWPAQWVDYLAANCGPTKLFGAEVTKPRKNAATATLAERNAYRDAILALRTNPAFVFFGGLDYWRKQQEVHSNGPPNRHNTPAFLPWHRELINRYEVLLQEFDPNVKLLYWDWTTDPRNSTNGFNFDTPTFMGNSGAGTGGLTIGAPFDPPLFPPSVTRDLGGNSFASAPTTLSDSSILSNATFTSFRGALEHGAHDHSHVYIGGNGTMSFINVSATDPFFFLLHANVDRLWAQWQRDPTSLGRLDPATTYDSETSDANITTVMRPWDGTGPSVQPWTTAGGYIVGKLPSATSVVSPPIYDTAPLTVPILQPGEAAVVQIPWYPPNPADFSCFGADQGHVCLLARIETSTAAPFGMASAETADVNANTRNNNNIAWKNVTVVNFSGTLPTPTILLRNIFKERVQVGIRFVDTQRFGASFFGKGRLFVDLKPELLKRWRDGRALSRGIKVPDDKKPGRLEIVSPEASIQNLTFEPNEAFSVDLSFELPKEPGFQRVAEFDIVQVGAPGKPDAVIGGQRFVLDFTKLLLVKSGAQWRYLDEGSAAPAQWISADFDDSKWKLGTADLGFGGDASTTVEAGPPERRHVTTYFRRIFDMLDPNSVRTVMLRLKRDDGAVVYLNGKEIHRVNLPVGRIDAQTLATRDVTGLEKEVFFPAKIDPKNLIRGRNTLAVEVHLNSQRSNDLAFDLELSANRVDSAFPPDVAFAEPPDGALFQPKESVAVKVDALDSDGKIKSVSLFVDGKSVGTTERTPYVFKWIAGSLGTHRLRAVAVDNDNKQSESFRTVTIMEKVPPSVTLKQPLEGAMFKTQAEIAVSAQAFARTGKVNRVEYWVREHAFQMAPVKLAATAKTPPYKATIEGLEPGHYMLWAIAIDDRGASSQSLPVHVHVGMK